MSDITAFPKFKPKGFSFLGYKTLDKKTYRNTELMLSNAPVMFKGIKKSMPNEKVKFILLPNKDGSGWQFVNLTKGYISPCKFKTKEEALDDFDKNYLEKYSTIGIRKSD